MASRSQPGPPPTTKQTVIVALAMGVVAGGCGGALGYMLGGKVSLLETTTSAQGTASVSPSSAATAVETGPADPPQEKGQGHDSAHEAPSTGKSNNQEDMHASARPKTIDSRLAVRELAPIITNLAEPADNWIRLQAAIVFYPDELLHPEKTIAELTSDITAYLRTVTLSSLEGADGLRRLQDELSERANIRSNGKIHEFIVETMVVQ